VLDARSLSDVFGIELAEPAATTATGRSPRRRRPRRIEDEPLAASGTSAKKDGGKKAPAAGLSPKGRKRQTASRAGLGRKKSTRHRAR
jgi:hypothetical protein